MSAMTPAPRGVALRVILAVSDHALRVLQDPGFHAAVKRDGWQFLVSVASEARAAWLRT